jgi:hypothetical protein
MAARDNYNYDCQPTKDIPCDGWNLKTGETIGEESVHGTVYIVCKDANKDDCFYALKLVKSEQEVDRVENEVQMQNLCASKDFCLPVIDWWIHRNPRNKRDDFGVIITGLMRESIHNNLLRNIANLDYSWKLIKDCLIFIYNFHQNGMYHNDAHLGNIMFTHDGELKFIDLDTAELYSNLFAYRKCPGYFNEAVKEDYDSFELRGLYGVVDKADNIPKNVPGIQLINKIAHIIRWRIVHLINKTQVNETENENPFQYLDRLRNIEYENLNKLLAMSIDDIMRHPIMYVDPGAEPLPLTDKELITRPVPTITLIEGNELKPPIITEPVNMEVLGPPRTSIPDLASGTG